jgi:DNA-binding IclR family transcriptional regulator
MKKGFHCSQYERKLQYFAEAASMPETVMPKTSAIGGAPAGAQSIDRAMSLLRIIAARHLQGSTIAELVASSGLGRVTVYRMASSLARAGLVARDAETGAYRLGIEAMALGLVSMRSPPLVALYQPAMRRLARQTGEHVYLVARAGDYSQCLHLEQGSQSTRGFAEVVGSMRLLGLGIPSLTFLARMSDREAAAHHERHREDYLARRMSAARLLHWARQVRKLGFAEVAGRGIGGVGVSVAMGSCGEAALGVVAPTSRMAGLQGSSLVALIREEVRLSNPNS